MPAGRILKPPGGHSRLNSPPKGPYAAANLQQQRDATAADARPCFWRFAGLAVGRRADLLSAARGAHDAGESRVAIRGAGSPPGVTSTRSQSQRSSRQRAMARRCRWSSEATLSRALEAAIAWPPKQSCRLNSL